MSLFEQFATNRKAEVEGIPVTFGGTNTDGTVPTFRIARMGRSNKRYQKMIEAETKPHLHAIKNDTLAPEIDAQITRKVFVHTVLLGWDNVAVPQVFGTEEKVPFTPDNALKLFDEENGLPELYYSLREQAQKFATFRQADIEEDSKN
jgi:hypothetical protein